jgi:hypothetical protein
LITFVGKLQTVNLQGGGGTNTMKSTGFSSWTINATDAGVWSGNVHFTAMQNLVAGTSLDRFRFQGVAGNITGSLTLGILDYSADGGMPITVNLLTKKASRIGGTFKGVWYAIGSTATTDTLIAANTTNKWLLLGPDFGEVNGFYFQGIENLMGGTGADSFKFAFGGSISGNINGGGGNDVLDYSADGGAAVTVNLQTAKATRIGGTFSNITALVGSTAATDTLIGANSTNTWSITGPNAGTVNAFSFSSIKNLQGGTGVDVFAFTAAGSISGSIDGGGAPKGQGDWLDYSARTTAVTVNLSTGFATSVAGGVSKIQNVIGSAGNDTLTGNSLGNILIGGAGTNIITGGSGRNLLIGGKGTSTLVGGAGDDILIAGTTTFDHNIAALMSILEEWQRADKNYADRITDLRNGGGFNGSNRLIFGTTVLDNDGPSKMTGGPGLDWFFGLRDEVTDGQPGEQIN